MFNQIVFPPYEGLPFQVTPPTIDGYVEPEKLERARQTGTPTTPTDFGHPSEVGYTHGARFSYDEGGGTGFAPAAFQGVWDAQASLLYLGFLVRYDMSFDQDDRVVIALRQGADTRRIDIQPNPTDSGATPPDDPVPAGLTQPTVHVRTKRQPFLVTVYRPNPAGSSPLWTTMTAPAALKPLVRTVQEDGSTTGRYWSVELTIPTQTGGPNPGGNDWLNLSPQFELYVSIIQIGQGTTVVGDQNSIQSTWPYDPANPEAFVIQDPPGGTPLLSENWPITTYGQATLLAPGQPNPGRGVKFENGAFSIGVLQADNTVGSVLDMRNVGTVNNLVARLVNTDVTDPPPDVLAEFRLAEFGIGGGMPGVWDKVPSIPNPSAPVQVPSSAVHTDLTSAWTISAADRAKYVGLWNDQCLWVLLSSTTTANFVEASMRHNLTVKLMSEYNGGFVVHASGFPRPASGVHEFLLHSVKVPVALTGPDPIVVDRPGQGVGIRSPQLSLADGLIREALGQGEGGNGKPPGGDGNPETVAWIWVTNAYRATGRFLTLGRRRTRIYVHAGSFGHLLVHTLQAGETRESVDLAVSLEGSGIRLGRDGLSILRVRDGDKAVVATSFRPVPAGETHHGGGSGQEQGFLRWLIALLRRLLRWLEGLLRRNSP
jgi:hypothetical protein